MTLWRACREGNLESVRQLIQDGQDVNTTGGDIFGTTTTPLICAASTGHVQVVRELIRKGADVNAKVNRKQTVLHKASWLGHSSIVTTLIEAGANFNEQDVDGRTPLMEAAWCGWDEVVLELVRAGADVNAKDKYKQTALHKASLRGHSRVVTSLIEAGANLNEQDVIGMTPLMKAAVRGYDQLVLELIRAGADLSVVSRYKWGQVAAGSTALHFAAAGSTALRFAAALRSIKCGVCLVEAGAAMRTRNQDSKSPLDLSSHDFRQTIQQAQSFSTKRIVAVIGNVEHGKSTLIAALQAEGNSLLKKFTNRFAKVQDVRQRTAGIEAVHFSSQKYGETLFYDFAGQSDYHGPHQPFLEAMLSKSGVLVSLLLLVKATDEEDSITQQVAYWLQPLSLASAPPTPQVILVGSFLDQVKSREEATEKLLRCTQSVQEEYHLNICGPCLLDCRKPESEGINQICTLFQQTQPFQLNSATLSYNLHRVLAQVRRAFSVPAITLQAFQSWLLENGKLLLWHMPPAMEVCHDLTAVGHALFLPNKRDPSQSWLILDLQAILHEVYGTLFSGALGKVNHFGLLQCNQLIELFPNLDPTMIKEVLISLEFCIQIVPSLMRGELLKLTAEDEEYKGEGWLYFPALVLAQPPEVFPEDADPQGFQWVCWQLRTAKKHLISAHLLQTIILRLAANRVFTHELSPSVREHCCSVWVNGLSWMSINGVDIAVQISDSSVVQAVGRSKAGAEKLHQSMLTIVTDVIKTTAQLSPKLEATSYVVHPCTRVTWENAKATPPESLYPIMSIIRCISDGGDHVLSLPRQAGHHPCRASITELFGGWCPSLSVVQDMDFRREPQSGECVFPITVCQRKFFQCTSFSSFACETCPTYVNDVAATAEVHTGHVSHVFVGNG